MDRGEERGGAVPGDEATLVELLRAWRARDPARMAEEPERAVRLARRFLSAGHPLLAHEVLRDLRPRLPDPDPAVEHLFGLVLARSGATTRAAALARDLRRRVQDDPVLHADVLGLLGRTEKDLAARAEGDRRRRRHLRRALAIYRGAFRRTGASYAGINAATLALLLGRDEAARTLAREAMEAVERERREGGDGGGEALYWNEATLGEAALLLGERDEAERRYGAAAEAAEGELSDLASMRRQARLILRHRGESADWLDRLFGIPRVGVFVGQGPASPDGSRPGFPAEAEADVTEALRKRLDALGIGLGFASASPGSEILFLEQVRKRGGETTVVLPFSRDAFLERRVRTAPGGGWEERFEGALAAAVEEIEASSGSGGGVAEEYHALLLVGLAGMQARFLDTELVPLAVWDGSEGPESPAPAVRSWREQGHRVEVVWPPGGGGADG